MIKKKIGSKGPEHLIQCVKIQDVAETSKKKEKRAVNRNTKREKKKLFRNSKTKEEKRKCLFQIEQTANDEDDRF